MTTEPGPKPDEKRARDLSPSQQLTTLATLENLRVVRREDDAMGFMRWSVTDEDRLPRWCADIRQNGYLMISKTAQRRRR